jgi:hypothetical protein
VIRLLRTRHAPIPILARVVISSLIVGTAVVATQAAHSATASTTFIDSGGSGGADSDGHTWKADTGYVGGTAGSTTATISGTNYQNIFHNWRAGMSAYHIAVANGTYYVKLLESEDTYNAAGKRVFSVTAEGVTAVSNVDIWSKAGGMHKALYLVFSTTVNDGSLDLGFTATHDQAKVDGIALEPKSTTATPSSSGGVLWGMNDSSTYDSTEKTLGRSMTLVREYRRLDEGWVNSRFTTLANSGHSLVLSVRSIWGSTPVKYTTITSGKYDATFLKGFAALNALKTKTFFIFQHEPESTDAKKACSSSTSDSVCGPEFVKAFQHVYSLAKSHGYNRLIFTETLEGYSFTSAAKVRSNYYWVGTSYTDWFGLDQYNSNCSHTSWTSFSGMISAAIQWLQSHAPTKSIIMPEYGAQEGSTASAKPNFFSSIPTELKQTGYSNIKGVVYWNQTVSSTCNYKYNTTTASSSAFKNLGLNSVMQASAPV